PLYALPRHDALPILREFLYVDDMARACLHVMNLDKATYSAHTQPMLSHINVGYGSDITIRELAETVKEVTHYQGRITFDANKPRSEEHTSELQSREN